MTTGYLLDDHSPTGYVQVLDEVQGPFITRSYVYGLELIEQDRISGSQQSTSYNVYDGHGSVRALTDTTGAVTDTYDYDAFGNLIHSTGSTPNVYLYSGEQFDPDLRLYYNRARYLSTSTSRFWSMDSYEGDTASPLSLHKYLFAGNDPIDRIDPSGNDDIAEFSVASAVETTLQSSIFTIVLSVGSIYKTLHDLPTNPFISSRPDGVVAGFQVTKSGGFLGELGLGGASVGGGVDAVFPIGRSEVWVYPFVTPFSAKFNFGLDVSIVPGLQTTSSLYVGAVWDAKQPSDYKGPFFCSTYSQALFGPLPAGFPYRPDLTVCSSQRDNGKPGAYTLTFEPASSGTQQIGTYFSYYFSPAVINLRDLERALPSPPGPGQFPFPPISIPPITLPNPF